MQGSLVNGRQFAALSEHWLPSYPPDPDTFVDHGSGDTCALTLPRVNIATRILSIGLHTLLYGITVWQIRYGFQQAFVTICSIQRYCLCLVSDASPQLGMQRFSIQKIFIRTFRGLPGL